MSTQAVNGRRRPVRHIAFAATFVAILVAVIGSSSPAAETPPALGTTVVQSGQDWNPAGVAQTFPAIASSSGSITSLKVYVDSGSTATSLVAGLYADAAGKPGSLIAQGTGAATPSAWNDVPLAASITAGTRYWIALLGPSGTLRYRDNCCSSGAAVGYASAQSGLTVLPATWASGQSYNVGDLSAYALVAASAPLPMPVQDSPAAPALGSDALQPSADWNPAGVAQSFPATARATGSVSSLRVYVDAGSTASELIAGIYADSNGVPGTLLGQGKMKPTAAAWNNVAVSANITAGTNYWIAVLGPSGTLRYRDQDGVAGAATGYASASNKLVALPAVWASGKSYRTGTISAFATLGAVLPPPPPPPPPPEPTPTGPPLGSDAIQPGADWNPAGMAQSFPAVARATGSINSLRVYVDAGSTATQVVAGLYTDAAGRPGTLISQGSAPATASVWNTVGINASITSGTRYWIAILGPSGTLRYRDQAGTTGAAVGYASSQSTLSSLPANWSNGSAYSVGTPSVYATLGTADSQAPTAPAAVTLTGSTSTSISISWPASGDNIGVAGYGVYRNGTSIGSTSASTRSFTFSALECGTTYTLGADAYDEAGNRSGRTSVSASTSACPAAGTMTTRYVSVSGSDANACTQTSPCATFMRAYRVASAGDTVEVADGSYPAQTMTGDSTKSSGAVLFRPASGATVTVYRLTLEGASFLAFRAFSVSTQIRVWNGNPGTNGSRDVLFESMKAPTFKVIGQVRNITFRGGEFGNTLDNQPQIIKYNQSDPDSSRPFNILIENAWFHDFRRSGSSVHTECLQILNGDTITVRRSRFNVCDGTAAIGITDGPTDNLTIENNFFGAAGDAYYTLQITKSTRNLVFRNNSMAKAFMFSDTESGGPYLVAGNYGGHICSSGVTYRYNVLLNGKCGTTDVSVSSLKFVNAGALDLHLRSDSEAINRGDPMSYPPVDLDGEARPKGGAPDAGADEAA